MLIAVWKYLRPFMWTSIALTLQRTCTAEALSSTSYLCRHLGPFEWFYHIEAGHCWAISTDTAKANWKQARNTCQFYNTVFAKVNSLKVSNYVKNAIIKYSEKFGGNKCAWIGASDKDKEGRWVWTDGEDVRFNLWENQDFFSRLSNFALDCGAICLDKNNRPVWKKELCITSRVYPVMCQYDADVVKGRLSRKEKPKGTARNTVYMVVGNLANYRTLLKPDWLASVWTAGQCCRACREHDCVMFVYCSNGNTIECFGYQRTLPSSENRVEDRGCTTWKNPLK